MKTNKIQTVNFQSKTPKPRQIKQNLRDSLHAVLFKMNGETQRVQEGDSFKTTITTKLRFSKDVIFEDERRLKEIVPYDKQMQGLSNLKIGNKIFLDIDNETGEIIDYKKPFYKPLFMVLRKAGNILDDIRTNFNLPGAIQKYKLTLQDLTPEGQKKMKRFVLQTEKARLEKIIKELEEDSK